MAQHPILGYDYTHHENDYPIVRGCPCCALTMPLRCLDPPRGKSIHSFDLHDDEWQALKLENRTARHLRMPCCESPVVLKRSRLGTRFFAHMKRGNCATAP